MKRVVTLVGMVGLLGGCANGPAQSPWLTSEAAAIPTACAPLSQDQELALNLAQKTADEGRLHAALANLERLPDSLPQARLNKARILRSLNRPEARELYASLISTCLKAQGEHGLGQLSSAQGRYDEALSHLRLAASLDPTSAAIRNDLGVVYMNLGRLDEARFELLTSLELNEAEQQPALNLLTLLIYQGMLPQANALAERMGFSASQLRAAEDRAQTLRSQRDKPASAATAQSAAANTQPLPWAAVVPATIPVEAQVVPVPKSVVAPAVSAPVSKPVMPTPVAQPVVKQAPSSKPVASITEMRSPAVPAPQLSNFRPTPVVPPTVAAAAIRAPTAPAPEARAAVAQAPAPTVASSRVVASTAAPQAVAPVVAVKPAAVAVPKAVAVRPPVAPVASAAPAVGATASVSATPAVPAGQGRALIEMRPGRLIVPDDGGFVRVEPISGS